MNMDKRVKALIIEIESIRQTQHYIAGGDTSVETLSSLAGLYEALNLDFILHLAEERTDEEENTANAA